jgi:phosphatidylserine/phosphatidylglycerophosphate/cardiolipin synthase-like enzyme
LPASVPWDLPPLLAIIDGAKTSVKLEFLTYSTSGYDKVYWDALDRSLRRAANRGVKVELLVADWSKKYPEALQSLEVMKNIDVKFMVIPVWSGGFVDFSRVMHSKYLVADGARAWLGTSNASRDYFHGSRNVSLFVDGAPFAQALEQHFALSWGSPYAEAVNPAAAYTAPKTK